MRKEIKSVRRQTGVAALLVAVILLLAVSLITMFAARVGVQDQRISGNEYRAKEAFFAAEAGLEQTFSFLRNNPSLVDSGTGWVDCDGDATIPCGDGSANKYARAYDSIVATSTIEPLAYTTSLAGDPPAPFSTYLLMNAVAGGNRATALSIGGTVDGTGQAIVRDSGAIFNLLTNNPIPPLTAPIVDLNGNFTIVANPNNEVGNGVPISLWSDQAFEPSGGGGSYQTCHSGEYRTDGGVVCNELDENDNWSTCDCRKKLSSKDTGQAYDIVDSSPDFPDDPFAYIFLGKTPAQMKDIAAADGLVLPDCSDDVLQPANDRIVSGVSAHNLIYVTGSCSVRIDPLGSREEPVILITEGQLTLNGGGGIHIWGVLFDNSDGTQGTKLNGTVYMHGVLISQVKITVNSGGSYNQIYDHGVFKSITAPDENSELARCVGCWFDGL